MFCLAYRSRCVLASTSAVRQAARGPLRTFRSRGEKGGRPSTNERLAEGPQPSRDWGTMLGPTLFTGATVSLSLVGCALAQYEAMREAAIKSKFFHNFHRSGRKAGDWREALSSWWAGLPQGHRLFWPIAGLNLLVWCAWRLPSLEPTMLRLFMCSVPSRGATSLPLLLSTFSHISALHLGVNMFVLHSLTPMLGEALGSHQLLALYLSGGVMSSWASCLAKVASGRHTRSLGASGAILTLFGVFACLSPESRMQVVFLPFFTFSALTAVKALALTDSVGLLAGWKLFDHACHLAGLGAGLGYVYWGHRLWDSRERLVTVWHNFRDTNRRD